MSQKLQQKIDTFMLRKQREYPDLNKPVDELINNWR